MPAAVLVAIGLAACGESEATPGDGVGDDTSVVGSDAGGSGDNADAAAGGDSGPDTPDVDTVDAGGDSAVSDPDSGDDVALTDVATADVAQPRGIPCDVATILEENCVSCHSAEPLYGSPMPLVTRDDLRAPAVSQPGKSVFELSLERISDDRNPMPPAPAARLDAAAIATLQAWYDAGAPSGEGCQPADDDVVESDAGTDAAADTIDDTIDPPSDTGPDDVSVSDVSDDTGVVEPTCDWEVEFLANNGGGEGDTTPFTVPMDSNHYECFYFSPTWDTDAHGLKFSAVIDDERVVHHWLLYAESGAGTPGTRRGCSGSHENATLIAGWAPGGDDWVMPADVGMQLPADTTYFVEIHYANPRRLTTTDRSGVRVCGTNTLRPHTAGTHWLGTELILLLGAGAHETTGTCTPTLTEPAHILRSWPHMHRYGVGMQSEILRADGSTDTLIDTPFSFDNQISHETPFTIYPGDRITTTCQYVTDTAYVTFGPDTEQEMCYNFVVAWPVGAFDTGGGVRGGSDNFCLR